MPRVIFSIKKILYEGCNEVTVEMIDLSSPFCLSVPICSANFAPSFFEQKRSADLVPLILEGRREVLLIKLLEHQTKAYLTLLKLT